MTEETGKKPSLLWFTVPIFFVVVGALFSYDEAVVNGPSFHWFVEPLIFGILGGLISFVATKDRDPRMAEDLFAEGVFGAVLLFILNFYALGYHLNPDNLGWPFNYVVAAYWVVLFAIGLVFIIRGMRRD